MGGSEVGGPARGLENAAREAREAGGGMRAAWRAGLERRGGREGGSKEREAGWVAGRQGTGTPALWDR